MEFVFGFRILMFFINLFKISKIIRAFRIDALKDVEVLAAFLFFKRTTAVRTFKKVRAFKAIGNRAKMSVTNFAEYLSF